MAIFTSDRQSTWTQLVAGCGHPTSARLSLDAEQAGYEIFQLTTQPCIPCAIKQRQTTRGICWSDPGGR